MILTNTFTEQTRMQSVKEIGNPLMELKDCMPDSNSGFFHFKGDGINLRQLFNLKTLLGDVTQCQLQPKGKKHVTTEAESPTSIFPDLRTRCSLKDFRDGDSSVKQSWEGAEGQICPSQYKLRSKQ